jgi:phosphotransferase system enzyme I (PtsI)
MVLLALGLEEFSMTAGQIPMVKNVIRQMSRKDAQVVLEQAMTYSSAEEIERFIKADVERRFNQGDLMGTGVPRTDNS